MVLNDVPEMGTVVVLSGMLSSVLADDGTVLYQFNDSVNRFDLALHLLDAGKAQQVVFTRGQMPWSTGRPEGDVLRDVAMQRGIDGSRIFLTGIASNTEGEAVEVLQLLGEEASIGLITSAFHMPRAQMLFEGVGLNVVPLPSGFRGSKLDPTVWDFVPSAAGLDLFSDFVRELLGRAYYGIRYG
ncbi:YdcF family protein [Rhodobacterales bacterium LSUCC0246]|nr:YdcF family protein [Rhodobacterales bacterium LSUCC0374]